MKIWKCLMIYFVLAIPQAQSEDAVLKLDSINGASSFVIQDANAVPRMTVNSAGYIGVGNDNPQAPLCIEDVSPRMLLKPTWSTDIWQIDLIQADLHSVLRAGVFSGPDVLTASDLGDVSVYQHLTVGGGLEVANNLDVGGQMDVSMGDYKTQIRSDAIFLNETSSSSYWMLSPIWGSGFLIRRDSEGAGLFFSDDEDLQIAGSFKGGSLEVSSAGIGGSPSAAAVLSLVSTGMVAALSIEDGQGGDDWEIKNSSGNLFIQQHGEAPALVLESNRNVRAGTSMIADRFIFDSGGYLFDNGTNLFYVTANGLTTNQITGN